MQTGTFMANSWHQGQCTAWDTYDSSNVHISSDAISIPLATTTISFSGEDPQCIMLKVCNIDSVTGKKTFEEPYVSTGTPIYASDGGKIIKANYWSGHGLCVEIDHGNGIITRYSHCSRVFVSIGDLVYQGQHIANVGNTGHSFGSHCHFEVRVNGSSRNPRNYIKP